jgi:hypothetical protein
MPVSRETRPIEDSIAKVNNELAVGSDLEFQGRWENLENVVWIFLSIFLLLSFAGLFGRGPLAKAKVRAPDGSMQVSYERFQRFSTPSVFTIEVSPASVQNGQVQLWVSDELVKPLGNQRIIPQPEKSQIGNGGITYTFPASETSGSIEFQSQPAAIGKSELKMRIPGSAELDLNIYVMP